MQKNCALYIHIPFCARKCAYCDFASYEDFTLQDKYFAALKREIEIVASAWDGRRFDTLFIGGGTPTCAKDVYIEGVIEKALSVLKLDVREATVEANPGTVDADKLRFYLQMGMNRISFGVQAAQDSLLREVGRIHDFETAKESVRLAERAGFSNISVDLMSGLPGQTESDLLESVRLSTDMGINHISMYTLKLEEGTPLYRAVNKGEVTLPGRDEEYEMSKAARAELSSAGYDRYEVSNYAKSGYECAHNLHYWHNNDYLGVGLAAASGLGGRRTINTRDINGYIKKIDEGTLPYEENAQSGDEEYAFETLMLGLRLVRVLRSKNIKPGMDRFAGAVGKTIASLRNVDWRKYQAAAAAY